MYFRLGGLGGIKAFSTSPLKVEVDLEMHIAAHLAVFISSRGLIFVC